MKNVYIINAGGFGRNMASVANSDSAHGRDWVIRGFLDGRSGLKNSSSLPIVGDPMTWRYENSQIIICALGNPQERRKYAQPLLNQGADFMCLTPDLFRSDRVIMGCGCLFEHHVSIGPDTQLGDFVVMLAKCIIGYDVKIGSYTTIGSFTFIGGGVQIGESVTIHPHATILPGIKVGNGAIIGAGSVVIRNVPSNTTVFGNPAKPLNYI